MVKSIEIYRGSEYSPNKFAFGKPSPMSVVNNGPIICIDTPRRKPKRDESGVYKKLPGFSGLNQSVEPTTKNPIDEPVIYGNKCGK